MNYWVVFTFLNSISILGLLWLTSSRFKDLDRRIDLELDKRMHEVRL